MRRESLPGSASTVSSTVTAPSEVLFMNNSPLPSPTFMVSLPVENTMDVEVSSVFTAKGSNDEVCEKNVAEQEKTHQPDQCEEHDTETVQEVGRYEYMDIRSCDCTEESSVEERCGSQTSEKGGAEEQDAEQTVEVMKSEDEGRCQHNTDKQPSPMEALSDIIKPTPAVFTAAPEMVEEYEEMARCGVMPSGWEQPEYQNFPVKALAVCEEVGGGRCAGIRGYIKVCAGIGEPGANTSFDNPDYWHSRVFLNTDAVRT